MIPDRFLGQSVQLEGRNTRACGSFQRLLNQQYDTAAGPDPFDLLRSSYRDHGVSGASRRIVEDRDISKQWTTCRCILWIVKLMAKTKCANGDCTGMLEVCYAQRRSIYWENCGHIDKNEVSDYNMHTINLYGSMPIRNCTR